jgi:UDPglucose 6-dehydrogenase
MKVAVVGTGYVGLVAGACFAEQGNEVICVDINPDRIAGLNIGEVPIYEPGLPEIVNRNRLKERLSFTTSTKDAVEACEVIFIAVGTPQDEDGSADLTHVLAVAKEIGKHMNGPKVVVDKSTVPVGTGTKVLEMIKSMTSHQVEVVSNPEFLKEGAAVQDFLKPDRVVVGVSSSNAEEIMRELYAPFVRTNNPILVMDVVSAELTKYAANAMLAARVSFMNEVAQLCEIVGADINHVRVGMGTDSRIGMSFLFSGIGYGGSCFPKDVQALIRTAADNGLEMNLPIATEKVNKIQKQLIVKKIKARFGSKLDGMVFGIWGLAFKPRTDDVREAPALTICRALVDAGARLQAYDPEAMETFKIAFGDNSQVTYVKDNYEAVKGADALVICTEWSEFRNPNYEKIKSSLKSLVIFDGRNILSRTELKKHPFEYYPIGRSPVGV